ncbi:Repressor ROX1 [Termitomyces sp. T112]|nr:Repressor ROX1 [Termitomyces sp. T112]
MAGDREEQATATAEAEGSNNNPGMFQVQYDETDMPPLVEPPASMTYTFSATAPVSTPTIEEVESYVFSGPLRNTYHGKRRDASYIPRPPNAFILFRSSFIREQNVTGKVEGNHSNLSKIIGKYWKALPKSEHDAWEAKAVEAQLEHRRRFPDWRFSPGANAAANAKVKRYVVDSGGGGDPGGGWGGTDGGGGRRRRSVSMSMRIRAAKDPPDDDADEDDEDDGVDVVDDDDDDSDYEEGPSSRRRKQKSKVKPLRMKAKPRRRRGSTKGEDERADGDDNERIDKITDLLVEGKKGVELERALEQWQTEKRARVHVHNAPGGKSKSPPLIITINPAPASIPLTPCSSSMLSPMTPTLTPTPPLSPEVTQTQGVKRSLSAPAPDMRLGPSIQALGSYLQAQLGYGPASASTKKRNWSTASVSVGGEGEREVQGREAVSLPLMLEEKWDIGTGTDPCAGREQTGILSRPTQTQVFGSREEDVYASIGGEAYVAPFRIANLGPTESSSTTNTAEDETSTWADALQYCYPTPPASAFQVGAWDSQMQVRERGSVPQNMNLNPSASWWPSHLQTSPNEDVSGAFEPVREGSFDQIFGYGYGYGMSVGTQYAGIYGEMGRRYGECFNSTLGDVEYEQDQRMHRERQEWTMNPTNTPSTSTTVYSPRPIPNSPSDSVFVPNTATRPSTPTSPDANAFPNTDTDTNADGHTFFCPAVPSPIGLGTIPESSFSSLRGWDGAGCAEGSVGEMGLGQRHAHAQETWFGLGRMQSVGLGLGLGLGGEGKERCVGVGGSTSAGGGGVSGDRDARPRPSAGEDTI